MTKSRRMTLVVSLAISLVAAHSMQPVERSGAPSHIRFKHPRIAEVFRYAMKKSTAFKDLVRTLELQDRVVYIEEGRCHKSHSCLRLLSPPGRYIQVRLDPREPIKSMVARLAHQLYHASEIARDSSVVDAASLQTLYQRIGYRNENCPERDCWETRAAVAFEALVTRRVNGT